MNQKGILIILMPLLISCESTVANVEEYSLFANSETSVDTCSIFRLLYADDERLLASTVNASCDLVSIPVSEFGLNLEECECFLNYGRARSEVLRNYTVSNVCNDTVHVLATNPFGIEKIIKIPFEGISDISSWKIESTPYLQGVSEGNNFGFLDSDRYVFAGGDRESERVICILNHKEHSFEQYDYIPDDGFDSNHHIKHSIYTSNSEVFVNGSNILYVCGAGHLALIIDTEDGGIRYLYDEYPKYSAASDGINYVKDSKSSIGIRAFSTEKAIYLSPIIPKIVNGKYVPDNFKGYPPYCNDRIEVFSWEGIRLYSLCLDHPFGGYLVDKSGKRLYTFFKDLGTGVEIVYQYDLPEVNVR